MELFTSKEYLKIDIANSFGKDKLLWKERIAWFDENQDKLEELINQADAPAMYFAGINAWFSHLAGEKVFYPINLDATSSGFQMFSCLTRDLKAAQLCNVVDVGERMDGYTFIYHRMVERCGLQENIKRENIKKACMTSVYGSKAIPREVFGEELIDEFEEVMSLCMPLAWDLNKSCLDIWDPEAEEYQWVMPDNFHVHIKVKGLKKHVVQWMGSPLEVLTKEQMTMPKGRSLSANLAHSCDSLILREMFRRCMFNPERILAVKEVLASDKVSLFGAKKENIEMTKTLWKLYEDTGYLSVRILDYIDSVTINLVDKKEIKRLIKSLPKKSFQVLGIHDCYRCHPNYGNDLRKQYNYCLYELAKSKFLEYWASVILKEHIVPNLGELNPEDVLQANYALS